MEKLLKSLIRILIIYIGSALIFNTFIYFAGNKNPDYDILLIVNIIVFLIVTISTLIAHYFPIFNEDS
jgi:Mg/Co/Ni transporter MgtE